MHFVFVESNTTGTGHLAVERLLAAGHEVMFYCSSKARYPFLDTPSAALTVIETNTDDTAALAAELDGLARRRQIDALMTFSSFYVVTAAELSARYGLRALSPAAARCCHDKLELRRAMRKAGLPTPDFRLVSSDEEARCLAQTVRYPRVVKPRAESGSTGVALARDAGELLARCSALMARTENERGQPIESAALVEAYLDGPEYSVETVTLREGETRVVGVTAKHLSPHPYFVEVGHDFPADASPAVVQSLSDATLAALAAVGFDFGPAHTEIRLTAERPVVVEINPRVAGGMIPELVRYATGVDLLTAWIALVCGKACDLTPTRAHFASIRFLTAERAGRFVGARGLDEARAIPYVEQAHMDKRVGARVNAARSGTDRLGFVIASGADRGAVARALERALQTISVDVEPEG